MPKFGYSGIQLHTLPAEEIPVDFDNHIALTVRTRFTMARIPELVLGRVRHFITNRLGPLVGSLGSTTPLDLVRATRADVGTQVGAQVLQNVRVSLASSSVSCIGFYLCAADSLSQFEDISLREPLFHELSFNCFRKSNTKAIKVNLECRAIFWLSHAPAVHAFPQMTVFIMKCDPVLGD